MSKDFKEQVRYWRESSAEDFRVAELLFERGYYSQSLFFSHLSLEKMLKAMVTKRTKKIAPYVHDLRYLARVAGIALNEENTRLLETISTFHIAGRYQDAKLEFYKKYNDKETVKIWIKHTESLLQWLQEEFQKM